MGDRYIKKFKSALEEIQKGTPIKEAVNIPDKLSEEVFHTFKDLFSSKDKKEDEEKKPDPPDPKAIEETFNQAIVSTILSSSTPDEILENTEKEVTEIMKINAF